MDAVSLLNLAAKISFLFFAVVRRVQAIQCHSCSGQDGCQNLILRFPHRSGRCEIDAGQGKCFIRKDPNNVIYWGCIDDAFWPGVPWRTFNGCENDWDRAWTHNGVRRPVIWCFCDIDDCNVSIERVNATDLVQTSTATSTSGPTSVEVTSTSTLATTTAEETESQTSATTAPPVTSAFVDVCPPDHGCAHLCVVISGSPVCRCRQGFRLSDDKLTCNDINECVIDNGVCHQRCENTVGSYNCSCLPGYRLNSDMRTCSETCPAEFELIAGSSSCYKFVSPTYGSRQERALSYFDAFNVCKSYDAHLVHVDSLDEQQRLATVLATFPDVLDGWQGWWTGGQFIPGINLFAWQPFNRYVSLDSRLWGFQKFPLRETCVWIMSISYYGYTLANYDCTTKSGYICEYDLPNSAAHNRLG